ALRGLEHEVVVIGEVEPAWLRLDRRPAELLAQPLRTGRGDDLAEPGSSTRAAVAGDVRIETYDLAAGDRVSGAVKHRLAAGDALGVRGLVVADGGVMPVRGRLGGGGFVSRRGTRGCRRTTQQERSEGNLRDDCDSAHDGEAGGLAAPAHDAAR